MRAIVDAARRFNPTRVRLERPETCHVTAAGKLQPHEGSSGTLFSERSIHEPWIASTPRGFVWNWVQSRFFADKLASTPRGFVWNRYVSKPVAYAVASTPRGFVWNVVAVRRVGRRRGFNPTRVRLERWKNDTAERAADRFNPTRVRLERARRVVVDAATPRFNPTRVRLEPA